jgi:diguanylate cyclase (GGDEF)-like protein/PAS domain S-box-containing protein
MPGLQQRAETVLQHSGIPLSKTAGTIWHAALQQTLHDLQVHRIELEMQNDELRRKQHDLDTLQASYFDFYDMAPVGYCTVNESGLIDRANLTTAALLGMDRALLEEQKITRFIFPDDQDIFYLMCQRIIGTREPQRCELRLAKQDGTPFWARLDALAAPSDGGALSLRIVLIDITERKQMEEQVRQLAFYDPLTKLPNRRLLNDRLTQALADSKRSGRYGALMFLDLDNFKMLNDAQGHAAGDLLLMQMAQRMKACVREVDTVARLGGDEFVVMLGDLNEDKAASTTQAGSVAEKIRATLAEPYLLAVEPGAQADIMVEHCCTASIGLVVFIGSEGTQDDFLRLADTAMYQAKKTGNLIRYAVNTSQP